MKKIVSVVLSVMLIACSLVPLTVSANYDEVKQNDPILMPHSTPSVDGNITASDGWSSYAILNDDYAKYCVTDWAMYPDLKIYTAYDENGFYFAADINEPDTYKGEPTNDTFVYSTGYDETVEASGDVGVAGLNGDVFIMTIDPLGACRRAGYIDINDYNPWYCVGLYEGDVAAVCRTRVNAADITSQVSAAGHKTSNGWCFECMIPWTVILQDVHDITLGAVNLKVSDVLKPGSQFIAAGIYADRFDDTETEELTTINRFMTSPRITVRGDYSNKLTGDYSTLNGLYLYIGDKTPDYVDVSSNDWFYKAAAYSYSRGIILGDQYKRFMPYGKLTREMFVSILARMSGEDISSYKTAPFSDVPAGKWYTESVAWANAKGIVSGIGGGRFGLGNSITREQTASMLKRYAKYIKKNVTARADLSKYTDESSISSWAYDDVSWIVAAGYMSGTTKTTFAPAKELSRSEGAQIVANCYPDFSMNLFN